MLHYTLMISFCVFLSVTIAILDKKTRFKNLSPTVKNLIIGLIFGLYSCISMKSSMMTRDSAVSIKNAGPLCAGLIFSPLSGIVSGLIGGLYRFFAVYWGSHSYTRVACAVSTVFCGFAAAAMKKYFFNGSHPNWFYALLFSATSEVFHMLLILLTHQDDLSTAFTIVKDNSTHIIIATTFAVLLSVLAVSFVYNKNIFKMRKKPSIKDALNPFNIFLLSIAFIFFAMSYYSYSMQTSITQSSTLTILRSSLDEINSLRKLTSNLHEVVIDDTLENDVYCHSIYSGHLHLFKNGGTVVIDKDNKVMGTPSYAKDSIYFPLDLSLYNPGELSSIETKHHKFDFFFTYKHYGSFKIVAFVKKQEVMFSRDVSHYLINFMAIILLNVFFFSCYVFLRKNITEKIKMINELLMSASGKKIQEDVLFDNPHRFVTISEEINHTLNILKSCSADAKDKIDMESKNAEEFCYQSEHDALTGLLNRNGFEKRLSEYENQNISLAFAFIDTDYFKNINDRYGHNTGDKVLKKIAAKLYQAFPNDYSARIGGDEFAMLLLNIHSNDVKRIKRRIDYINNDLKKPSDGLPPVSISVGIALSEKGYTTDLMCNADMALYKSKDMGRGKCLIFDESKDTFS